MIESGRPSLLDLITFDPDIKILESFTYPVGAVCLLARDEKTCVFNIDSFYENLNTVYSSFQNPEETIKTYSRFFLERVRNGNFKGIDFNSMPNIRSWQKPDFVHLKNPNTILNGINYQEQQVA